MTFGNKFPNMSRQYKLIHSNDFPLQYKPVCRLTISIGTSGIKTYPSFSLDNFYDIIVKSQQKCIEMRINNSTKEHRGQFLQALQPFATIYPFIKYPWFLTLTRTYSFHPGRWEMIGNSICYGARSGMYGTIILRNHGFLRALKLDHVNGFVTCDRGHGSSYASHWGCYSNGARNGITNKHLR